MSTKLRKILSLALATSFLFQQSGFAQAAAVELNIASHLSRMTSSISVEKFRPLHLRYFSYNPLNDNFKVLVDKGDQFPKPVIASPASSSVIASPAGAKQSPDEAKLRSETQTLLNYFLVGVSLPDSMFWVNLRPDSEDSIIDSYLEKTEVGRIMLEADLQLKKDTSLMTSPKTPEGREYWDRLYKKAEELYGYENVTIPTLTRPWIVPGEIIVRESSDSAYIYKATLKVMLESDYLASVIASPAGSSSVIARSKATKQSLYEFKDARSKALNEYSTELIKELIIPKLTKEVNSSKRYAPLRQVYYSLILSRWFKQKYSGQKGLSPQGTVPSGYISLIDTKDLTNLISKEPWSKTTYFDQYKKSFTAGEYNIQEPVYTPTGQVVRSYFSGGIEITGSSPVLNNKFTGQDNLFRLPGIPLQGNSVEGIKMSASPIQDSAAAPVNPNNSALPGAKYLERDSTTERQVALSVSSPVIDLKKIKQYFRIREYGVKGIPFQDEPDLGASIVVDSLLSLVLVLFDRQEKELGPDTPRIEVDYSYSEADKKCYLTFSLRGDIPEAHILNRLMQRIVQHSIDVFIFTQEDAFGTVPIQVINHMFKGYDTGVFLKKLSIVFNKAVRNVWSNRSEEINADDMSFVLQEISWPEIKSEEELKKLGLGILRTRGIDGTPREKLQFTKEWIKVLTEEELSPVSKNLSDLTPSASRTNSSPVVRLGSSDNPAASPIGVSAGESSIEAYNLLAERLARHIEDALNRMRLNLKIIKDGSGYNMAFENRHNAVRPDLPEARNSISRELNLLYSSGFGLKEGEKELVFPYGITREEIEESFLERKMTSPTLTRNVIRGFFNFYNYSNDGKVYSIKVVDWEASIPGVDVGDGTLSGKRELWILIGKDASPRDILKRVLSYLEHLETKDEKLQRLYDEYLLSFTRAMAPDLLPKAAASPLEAALQNELKLPDEVLKVIGKPGGLIEKLVKFIQGVEGNNLYTKNNSQDETFRAQFRWQGDDVIVTFQILRYDRKDQLVPYRPENRAITDARQRIQAGSPVATGGIDFRTLPMAIQPMGSFKGLNFQLPKLTPQQLAQINIDTELQQLQNMASSGIRPSGQRVKELIAACVQKKQINAQADNLLLCLIDICKLEEENAYESEPELREALVIVDAVS